MSDMAIIGALLVTFVALSAFLSALHAALDMASRTRLAQLDKDGHPAAARALALSSDETALRGARDVSFAIAAVLGGVLTAGIAPEAAGTFGTVLWVPLVTVVLFVIAQGLPRLAGVAGAESVALALAPAATVIVAALRPLVQALDGLAMLMRGGHAPVEPNAAETIHEDLREAIHTGHEQGAMALADRNMMSGILDLKELSISDVMVHRQNMIMLDASMDPDALLDRVLGQPHTRLPVYRGNPDNIIGVLHTKDLFRALARARGSLKGISISALSAKPWFVPETTLLADQLRAFLHRRSHFALVIDEYGVLKGLVTLEDILEEIVGEIRDEHDLPVSGVRPQVDGTANVDGWIAIRELNRVMNWSLPDDNATTIAGLVIHESQTIPEPGQIFAFYGFKFEILKRQRNQITAMRITPPESRSVTAA